MKRVNKWVAILGLALSPFAATATDIKMIPSHIQSEVVTANPYLGLLYGVYTMATTTGTFTVPVATGMSMTINCPSSDTCSAPTLQSQFISVMGWKGFSVTVEAESGKTLTGVGTIDCYTWDPNSYNSVSFQQDISLAVTKTGVRRVTLQGQWLASARGYMTCVPTGVITSATGGIKLYIDGWK